MAAHTGCGRKKETQVEQEGPSVSAKPAGRIVRYVFPTNQPPDLPAVRTDESGQPIVRSKLFDDDRETGKQFAPLDESDQAQLNNLLGAFEVAGDDEVRTMILEEIALEDFRTRQLLDIAMQAMRYTDPDLLLAALDLIADFEDPGVLDVVDLAVRDQDPFVRAAAIETLRFVDAPEKTDILVAALEDWSDDVHDAVFDILDDQPDEVKFEVLENAAVAPDKQTVLSAIIYAQHEGVKESVDVFLNAMQNQDEDVSFRAHSAFLFLTGQEFETAADARAWWSGNQGRYTRDLNPR